MTTPNRPAGLIQRYREELQARHYARRTVATYEQWLRRFLRFSEELCKDWGLTSLQYQLLLHVMGFPGRDWATISELADRLQAHHHGVVALIDRCAKMELLERRPGRTDQRVVEIHLLPKGQKVLGSLATRHQDELHMLLREFSDGGLT